MKKILGIELGSTRIKSVLISESATVLATGSYEWENKIVNGFWSYSLDEVKTGLQQSYADLLKNYGEPIKNIDVIGLSGMMHGYLAFDKNGNQLAEFRTWRNTHAGEASKELCEKLNFKIPQRWSIAQFYQAVLDKEEHIKDVAFLTTLSGYVHWLLTGRKVLGVCDASGMFPINDGNYDKAMLNTFNEMLKAHSIEQKAEDLLPQVLYAGQNAGVLTENGAKLLDISGTLQAGSMFCPPEGDAGTGMVATNSVKVKRGNVSAGTSAFVMLTVENPPKKIYNEIDVAMTPSGSPFVMSQANNCTNEINAWTNLFAEVVELSGGKISKGELFTRLFNVSKESDAQTGKLFACNFLSGEATAGVKQGRPLFLKMPDGNMSLANFMQAQIYSALATLRLGMDVLKDENIKVESICGHGGFFKTEFIGQNAMSAVLDAPVTVMKNAGEGGAYGIALLALFMALGNGTLEDFLDKIFEKCEKTTVMASAEEKAKFEDFMTRYKKGLLVEKCAEKEL